MKFYPCPSENFLATSLPPPYGMDSLKAHKKQIFWDKHFERLCFEARKFLIKKSLREEV